MAAFYWKGIDGPVSKQKPGFICGNERAWFLLFPNIKWGCPSGVRNQLERVRHAPSKLL